MAVSTLSPSAGCFLTSQRMYDRPPQLAASFISNQACDVADWHSADIPAEPAFVRFWTKADKDGFLARIDLSANDPKPT